MTESTEQVNYEIKVKGELDPVWMEWFEDLTLTHDNESNTVFTGPIIDQTALHSLLLKIRDLNLKLISVNEVDFERGELKSIYPEKEIIQ